MVCHSDQRCRDSTCCYQYALVTRNWANMVQFWAPEVGRVDWSITSAALNAHIDCLRSEKLRARPWLESKPVWAKVVPRHPCTENKSKCKTGNRYCRNGSPIVFRQDSRFTVQSNNRTHTQIHPHISASHKPLRMMLTPPSPGRSNLELLPRIIPFINALAESALISSTHSPSPSSS